MRLYGALSELASLVIRLASGKTVTISSAEQNVDKTISIPALPEAVNSDEIVLKEAEQTLRRKTLEGVVTSGVSSVKLQSADVTSTNALEVPNGNPSISTGLRRLSSTGNLLYLGTGTAFKEMVDKDSSQLLKNKTIPAGGGVDENVITGLNPASPDVFLTVGGHADKVVKYNNSGVAQVAKIVNANIDDAAGIAGSKLSDNSVTVAKLASMSSADLAGKITDETGSGALVFGTTPSLSGLVISNYEDFAHSAAPANPSAGNLRVYAKSDNKLYTRNSSGVELEVGSGSGGSVLIINKASHGFVAADVGCPVYLNVSGDYVKAKADASNTAEIAGLINKIIDSSNFEVCLGGEVSSVGANAAASLTPGEMYFLSSTTAGALTATEPSTVGQISKPVGIARTSNKLDFFNMRGTVVGGANLRTQLALNGAALVSQTTNIQNVKDYTAGELAGWVYIDATTDRRFYIQVQFVKNAAGAWNCAYQTTGDTPPVGFNVDVIVSGPDAFVQVQMPPVAGWVSGSVNFALNAPAVGATLPLQISGGNVTGPVLAAGTGAAVPAGYIGEIITASLSDVPTSTTTVNTAYNAGSISLTNGVWIVFGKCAWTFGSGGPVWNSFSASISTTSATVHGPTSNVDYSAGLVKEWVAGTRIITVTGGSQTVYLVAGVNYTTGGTVNPRLNAANEYLYAIRIA